MVKVTEKQKRFANEYIISGNATQAAIKAGYSKKTAKVIGAENLTKPYIRAFIDEQLKKMEDEKIADATEVLEYLTKVMRGNEQEEVLIGGSKGRQAIIMMAVSAKDRIKAAEQLGKVYALFTDRRDVKGRIELPIFIDDVPEDDDDENTT